MMQDRDRVPAVELRHVTKDFGSVRALDDVSLAVQPGETVAVLGPNGAGKTTAISLMMGLRAPTSGEARLYGQDPRDPSARRRAGVMLQESGLPPTVKVREALELFRRLYPHPLGVDAALDAANLADRASAKVGTLSGGQKQRLYFALAVIANPDVLFLDEPTVGMDVESRRGFWERIDSMINEGKTLVLTTHYLEEADALADRIVVVDQGKIIADGPPSAIKGRVGGKRISFTAPGLGEAYLRGLPGVHRASYLAERAEVYSLEPEAAIVRLVQDGVHFSNLEVVGAGLEEAFIALTSKEGAAA